MVQIVAFCALGALDAFHARKLVCDRKILSPGFTSHVYPKIHMNESVCLSAARSAHGAVFFLQHHGDR